jgi:hypothetical protein
VISLSDHQLRTVMQAATALDPERRSVFLERIAAQLQIRLGQYNDSDVAAAAEMALRSLVQQPAA